MLFDTVNPSTGRVGRDCSSAPGRHNAIFPTGSEMQSIRQCRTTETGAETKTACEFNGLPGASRPSGTVPIAVQCGSNPGPNAVHGSPFGTAIAPLPRATPRTAQSSVPAPVENATAARCCMIPASLPTARRPVHGAAPRQEPVRNSAVHRGREPMPKTRERGAPQTFGDDTEPADNAANARDPCNCKRGLSGCGIVANPVTLVEAPGFRPAHGTMSAEAKRLA
jgi:hypothetical protein